MVHLGSRAARARQPPATLFHSIMDDLDAIPSISSGAVGSRFVSQSDIDTAKARRDEQWKAAYARYELAPARAARLISCTPQTRPGATAASN